MLIKRAKIQSPCFKWNSLAQWTRIFLHTVVGCASKIGILIFTPEQPLSAVQGYPHSSGCFGQNVAVILGISVSVPPDLSPHQSAANPAVPSPPLPPGPGGPSLLSIAAVPDCLPAVRPQHGSHSHPVKLQLQRTEPSVAPHCSQWQSQRFKSCKTLHESDDLPPLRHHCLLLSHHCLFGPWVPQGHAYLRVFAFTVSFCNICFLVFKQSSTASGPLYLLLWLPNMLFPQIPAWVGFLASFRPFLKCYFLSETFLAFFFKVPIPPDTDLTLITNCYMIYLFMLIVVGIPTKTNLQ